MTSRKVIAIDLVIAIVSAMALLLLGDMLELGWLGAPVLR
jgi:hypothetical protein